MILTLLKNRPLFWGRKGRSLRQRNGTCRWIFKNSDGFTESLNISVAAAIILESMTTRLRNSKLDWKLSDEEMKSLYQEWIEKSIKNIDNIKGYYWKRKDTGK